MKNKTQPSISTSIEQTKPPRTKRPAISHFSEKKYEYYLPNEWIERARKELGENPDTVHQEIQRFRERIQAEKSIRSRLDDCFCLAFLRARKYDHDRAFRLLRRYFDIKRKTPTFWYPMPPSEIQYVYQQQVLHIFKDRDPLGRKTIVLRLGQIDVNNFSIDHLFGMLNTTMEKMALDQVTQVVGMVVIIDLLDFSLRHAAKLASRKNVATLVNIIQETFPMRFGKIHVVNTPIYFDALYALFKVIMTEKMRSRVVVHGSDWDSLAAHIPREILPADYGGLQPKFDNTWWYEVLKEEEDMFKEMRIYGYKSPGEPDSDEDITSSTEELVMGEKTVSYFKCVD